MKYGKNKTTGNQEEWLESLRQYGYKTAVCYGADEARETIKQYIGWRETKLTEEAFKKAERIKENIDELEDFMSGVPAGEKEKERYLRE